MQAVLERETLDIDTPTLAHYARVRDRNKGGSIIALCGQRLVPTMMNPTEFPLCDKCIEVKALRDSFKV